MISNNKKYSFLFSGTRFSLKIYSKKVSKRSDIKYNSIAKNVSEICFKQLCK